MNNQTNDRDKTLERRAKIIEMLEMDGQVKVPRLSEIFNVSDVTIRNDLDQLESKSLLARSRGGALRINRVGIDYHLAVKSKKHSKEKQLIGAKAADLISENDTIILDSGTTTLEVAKNLSNFKDLTVITNALNIAGHLVNLSNVKLIIPGGFLRRNSLSLIGAVAEEGFRHYYCDKLFIGVDGIDSAHGISTPNMEESHLNQVMIELAKEIIVVTDSSKFLRRSFAFITPIDKIHTVITDSNIPKEELQKLINLGIKVIIVEVQGVT
jgi:DeoR family transcriptional regulator, aga operon transcriptional repressor